MYVIGSIFNKTRDSKEEGRRRKKKTDSSPLLPAKADESRPFIAPFRIGLFSPNNLQLILLGNIHPLTQGLWLLLLNFSSRLGPNIKDEDDEKAGSLLPQCCCLNSILNDSRGCARRRTAERTDGAAARGNHDGKSSAIH